MTFCEKIRMILNNNNLGINSASALEKFVGVSNSSISAHYTKEEEGPCVETAPGAKVQKAIYKNEKLRISIKWWETGEGEMFLPSVDEQVSSVRKLVDKAHENEAITWDLWLQLKQNNEKFQEEIDRLWEQIGKKDKLIDRLTGTGDGIQSIKSKRG